MSLSWRERLVATLTPERVHLRRIPAFRRRGAGVGLSLECQGAVDGMESWRPALACLAAALDGKKPDIEVVLSSHFVRLQLLPWQADLRSREEWQAYGAFRFQEIYGAPADAWDIVLSLVPPGQPALACAVDRVLLQALQALALEAGCRLASVQPAFALAWNVHGRALGHAGGAFVLAESGRLCAGLTRNGDWCALRNLAVADGDMAAVLPALLEQQALLAESPLEEGDVLVAGLEGFRLPGLPALPAGWRLQRSGDFAAGRLA